MLIKIETTSGIQIINTNTIKRVVFNSKWAYVEIIDSENSIEIRKENWEKAEDFLFLTGCLKEV